MKLKRSERMVVISNYLINNPYQLTSLNTFAERYEAAKSSISEDVAIIKKAFEESQIGEIETVNGCIWWRYVYTKLFLMKMQEVWLKIFVNVFPRVIVSYQVVISTYLIY